MELATGKGAATAVTILGAEPAAPDRGGFRGDMLDLVYARVNRCDSKISH